MIRDLDKIHLEFWDGRHKEDYLTGVDREGVGRVVGDCEEHWEGNSVTIVYLSRAIAASSDTATVKISCVICSRIPIIIASALCYRTSSHSLLHISSRAWTRTGCHRVLYPVTGYSIHVIVVFLMFFDEIISGLLI